MVGLLLLKVLKVGPIGPGDHTIPGYIPKKSVGLL